MYLTAILIGLVGSLHCLAMCSPITLLIGGNHVNKRFVFQRIQYNLGRLVGYAVLGVFAGFFGKVVWFFGVQQWLSLIFGIVLMLSLLLFGSHSIHNPTWRPLLKLTTWLKRGFSNVHQWDSSLKGLSIGVLNGFLPCGLVYMALMGAMSMPSVAESIIYMLVFGLGTWPMMLAVSFFGGWFKSRINTKALIFVPYIIALLFILRGLDLGIPYVSPTIEMSRTGQEISSCTSDLQ